MDSQALTGAATGVGLIALLTLPGLRRTVVNAVRAGSGWTALGKEGGADLYEDADGRATPASQRSFSTRRQKAFALVASLAGLGAAVGALVTGYRGGRFDDEDRRRSGSGDGGEVVCSTAIAAWLDLAGWVSCNSMHTCTSTNTHTRRPSCSGRGLVVAGVWY